MTPARLPLLAATLLFAFPLPECGAQSGNEVRPAPQIFAEGIISDANEQWRITFSRDRKTAWFAESPDFFPISRKATIYFSTLKNGAWSEPVVAPFSGKYTDMDPFVSANGKRLYFSSIRPIDGRMPTDIDLWMVERTRNGWSEPIHLGAEVNTADDELYASVSADGTLYFASGPAVPGNGKHWDIYASRKNRKGFAPRVRLGSGVNTQPTASESHPQAAWEFNPEISPNGKTLYFTSLRPGGFGFGDLYISHLVKGEWTPASNLGPVINSAADEYHPTLSPDGGHLYFIRRRPGKGNIYSVPLSALQVAR